MYFLFPIINPFQPSAFYIQTSYLICSTNQMTGVFMKCTTDLKLVNPLRTYVPIYFNVSLYHAVTAAEWKALEYKDALI